MNGPVFVASIVRRTSTIPHSGASRATCSTGRWCFAIIAILDRVVRHVRKVVTIAINAVLLACTCFYWPSL